MRTPKPFPDGVIAGFETALVEGGKPQDFKTIQADLEAAGQGLQKVCDAAGKAARAAEGTKGVVDASPARASYGRQAGLRH